MKGLVIKNTGSWYTVRTDDGQLLDCKVKGNFRIKGIRSTNPVAVGDRVIINEEGWITAIEDRRNYIIRKSINLSKQSHILAANVDQALLVVTVAMPETSTTFIDRFLASAEAYRVPVILVFNKKDVLDDDALRYLEAMMNLYKTIGYECRQISAATGEGVEELRPLLEGKITLLSGNSGVGKSTLINRLVPGVNLRTADISDAHQRDDSIVRRFRTIRTFRFCFLSHRHPGHQGVRHIRYGTRGDNELLPRDIPLLEGLSLL